MSGRSVARPPPLPAASRPAHLIGGYLFLALVLGGSAAKGAAGDLVLQLLALPFVYRLARAFPDHRAARPVNMVIGAIFALMIFQLIPSPGIFPIALPGETAFLVTYDAGRSLGSLTIVIVWISVFYSTLRMDRAGRYLILRYALFATLVNLAFAILQYLSPLFLQAVQFLPHAIDSGFFTNENHFSALVYIFTLFCIFVFRHDGRTAAGVAIAFMMVLFQIVVGSRAGVMLTLAGAAIGCAAISRSGVLRLALCLGAAAAAGMSYRLYSAELMFSGSGEGARSMIAGRTWQAVLDYLPLGAGFGNFQLIFPQYETASVIIDRYINHAHNEYLQLALEGGLAAAVLILVYCGLLLRQAVAFPLDRLQQAAGCAIAVLLVHSTVDYPLRTMALGVTFSVLNGIYFQSRTAH